MLRFLSKFILCTLAGWKLEGRWPKEIPKIITIVIPHTSYWDFPIGILLRTMLKVQINWAGKDSLFKPPLGWLLKWMGGVPIVRSRSTNFVDSMVDVYEKTDKLNFFIAPEGTRNKVEKLKTGFYYIAIGAKIPIFMVKFDYKTRTVVMREPFYPIGDKEADMKVVIDYFAGVQGKYPEKSFKLDI